MVDNKGNSYRTRGAVLAAGALIAAAVGLLVVGLAGMAWLNVLWIFLLIFGIVLAAAGATYSSTPDKFGPSEQAYRVVSGALLALIGLVGVLWSNIHADWYVYVAVLIIGIAVIGLSAALVGHKNSKF